MSDLRERAPATAVMQKLLSYRGTEDIRELPFGMVRVSNEAMMWLRGARGEIMMADRLRYLPHDWVVIHSVLVHEYADIDHIAIGPPGVFPINTKRLIDREIIVDGDVFRSDGWKKQYLAKAEIEARRVDAVLRRAEIAAKVLPIIAISGASRVKIKKQAHWHGRHIGVAKVDDVVRKLVHRPPLLLPEQVRAIADVLQTWSDGRGRYEDPPDTMLAEFRRIDRGTARFRGFAFGVALIAMLALCAAAGLWFNWTLAPRIADYIGSLYQR